MRGLQKHSTQCEMASIPVAAVSIAGINMVKCESQMLARGSRYSLMIPIFFPLFSVMRAARPTSLPLPAVVGMAISGGMLLVMIADPPEVNAYDSRGGG